MEISCGLDKTSSSGGVGTKVVLRGFEQINRRR